MANRPCTRTAHWSCLYTCKTAYMPRAALLPAIGDGQTQDWRLKKLRDKIRPSAANRAIGDVLGGCNDSAAQARLDRTRARCGIIELMRNDDMCERGMQTMAARLPTSGVSRLITMLCLLSAACTLAGAQAAAPQYNPADTSIAVLPVINASGERTPKFRQDQIKATEDELHKVLAQCGFQILDDSGVATAIANTKADLR